MRRFRLFVKDARLTELAGAIMSEDLTWLGERLAQGFVVDEPALLCPDVRALPLSLALVENKLAVVRLLLDHGANPNDEREPAIVVAAANCKAATLELLVARGARVDRLDRVGRNAYSAALHWNRYDLLPVIERLGLAATADGGRAFHQAVQARQRRAVEFFVERGVDVNARPTGTVFPSKPTAVAVAARNGELELVRYLVEHGADVTLRDDHGDRPYTHAVALKHQALRDFLAPLEPAAWHDEASRVVELEPFQLPEPLIELLRGKERRLELAGANVSGVEFHSLLGVKVFRFRGSEFVDLLAVVDDHWEAGFLTWSVEHHKLVHIDLEHREMRILCSWEEFMSDPARCIDSIVE